MMDVVLTVQGKEEEKQLKLILGWIRRRATCDWIEFLVSSGTIPNDCMSVVVRVVNTKIVCLDSVDLLLYPSKEKLESVVSDIVFFVIYPFSESKDSFLLYSVITIFVWAKHSGEWKLNLFFPQWIDTTEFSHIQPWHGGVYQLRSINTRKKNKKNDCRISLHH